MFDSHSTSQGHKPCFKCGGQWSQTASGCSTDQAGPADFNYLSASALPHRPGAYLGTGGLSAPFPRPTLQARHHQVRLGVKFGDGVRVRVIRSMSAHPMLLLSRLKSSVPLTVASWVDLHPRLSYLLKISVCQ